jgi:hypothetical protein
MIDVLGFGAFVAFGVASWYLRISYRVSIVAGVAFLVVAAVVAVSGADDAGNFIAILAYFSLVVGVSLAIAEHVHEKRERGNVVLAKKPKAVVIASRSSLPLSRLVRFIRRGLRES